MSTGNECSAVARLGTKLGEPYLKTLETQNCQDILISRTVCPWRGDEFMAKNERQEASNNIHIHCLILIKLQGCCRL